MPRAQSDDPLQSFRFQVMETDDTGFLETAAGFNSVTTPEVNMEVSEYREGNVLYTKKFSGVPSVENMTMSKGVAQGGSAFWDWGLAAINGEAYRADLLINVYGQDMDGTSPDDAPAHQLLCKNVLPSRVKPIGDLDATSSDINLQEIEGAMEELALKIISPDGTTASRSNT